MVVLKSKLNVMLLADKLDWEYAFLNRFLMNSESIALTPVIFRKGGGFVSGKFPSNQAAMNKYDLIILYDVSPSRLKSKQKMFESYLKEKGGGLLVFLGESYLGAPFPRWIDKLLPIINTKRRPSNLLYVQYSGQPIENYIFHPAVRIADTRQAIHEAWRNLPHFEALVLTDSLAENSKILVAADLNMETGNPPILAFRNFGAGKVLATTAMPYWHWAFFGYGFNQDDTEYRRLFDGIVNWLALKEKSDPRSGY